MSTATTQINITAQDSTAGAFNSAERNLSSLASSALRTTAGLAGIGLSIAGAVDAVKGIAQATIQFQQFTNTLQVGTGSAKGAADALAFVRAESQRLGLDLASSADQFAKLAAASKGTALEGKATRDIFSSMSEAATVLGLSADQTRGALNAFQQMISKGKVQAEELRGQLGERLPGAFAMAARAMGVTTAELDKLLVAGKITAEDLLPKLAIELNKTFGSQAEESAKGLQSQINRMNTALFDLKIAIGESGLINFLSSGIELATKLANAMTGAFGGGKKLSPIDQQKSLIQGLEKELEHMKGMNSILPFSDLIFSKKDSDLIKFRIETATEDLLKMKARLEQESVPDNSGLASASEKMRLLMEEGAKVAQKYADPLKVLREEQAKLKELVDAGAISQDVYNRALKQTQEAYDRTNIKAAKKAIADLNQEQSKALKIESEYIKLLGIERKQRQDLIAPYKESVKQATQSLDQMKDQISALKLVKERQISLAEAVELTTIARLEEKRISSKDPEIVKQINEEIEARKKIADLIPLYSKLERETNNTTDQMSQLWMQAGRNIQSTLANSIFNFFDDGLKGMVKNVISAVGRIASEFAALKLAQGIGLDKMFGMGGGTGSAGGSLLNLASMGSNAMSMLRGGFGMNSLIGGGLSSIGGSGLLGSFGAGMSGGSQAAAFIGAESATAGAASAASMGASFAEAAGPLMANAIGVTLGTMIAGDKKVGGLGGMSTSLIGMAFGGPLGAVIGGAVSALFGHGPLKFRQQSIQGTASSDGFDGDISNVFRAKGGLLVGNKHKTQTEQFSKEQQDLFDTTLKGFYGSAHTFAKNLGLSVDLVDGFTKEISIVSEKGKAITEEAIAEMLKGIGNSLAQNVMPMVDTLRKAGEDSFATLQRLNSEFVSLTNGAQNLGASVAYAKELIKSMSFEARTAFVDQAGGIDRINQLTSTFFDGFLTDAEKLNVRTDQLNTALTDLGLSTEITKDQFKALIQSTDTANDLRISLLELVPAFLAVRGAQQSLTGTTTTLAESERSLNDIRQELLSTYSKESNELQSTIDKFKNISKSLRDFKDSLSLGQLSPLTPAQKLEESRTQFNRTRVLADQGDQTALQDLPRVSQEFLQASQVYNASSAAYISDFNLVKGVLDKASKSAISQSEIAQSQLTELKATANYLFGIDDKAKTTNDLLKELLDATLNGKGDSSITTKDIQDFFAANPNMSAKDIGNAAIKFNVSKDQLVAAGVSSTAINKYTGGATLTNQQILDFVNSGATPMQIYQAAVANGVTSKRLSEVTGISLVDINKFVKDNKLQSFAKGTDFIAKSGLAMVHRAEAIVPSSTTDEIKKLREELSKLRQEQNQQTGDLMKVTDLSNQRNAKMIADAMAQIETRKQWNDRSKAGLR